MSLFDFVGNTEQFARVEFAAAGRKHADAIELQDQTGFGDCLQWPAEYGFRECRERRGSAEFWRHNSNAKRLPQLVSFVDRLPFFESTGKQGCIFITYITYNMSYITHITYITTYMTYLTYMTYYL
jgi:hypothetical protein